MRTLLRERTFALCISWKFIADGSAILKDYGVAIKLQMQFMFVHGYLSGYPVIFFESALQNCLTVSFRGGDFYKEPLPTWFRMVLNPTRGNISRRNSKLALVLLHRHVCGLHGVVTAQEPFQEKKNRRDKQGFVTRSSSRFSDATIRSRAIVRGDRALEGVFLLLLINNTKYFTCFHKEVDEYLPKNCR